MGLKSKFPLHPCVHLAHEGAGVDEELPMAHMIPQQISPQGLHRLFILEAFEGLLENSGELRGRRHLVTPRSALSPTFKREESTRRGGAGGIVSKGRGVAIGGRE